jgi:IclR family pca regulon transcriptional regulator
MAQTDPTFVKPPDPTENPDFVTALARGLSVIRAFSADTPCMTLADIGKRVALPRATVRRSLITLMALGYVEGDGRNFSLTPKVLTLGNSYLSSSPLPRAAQPRLERIAAVTRESCWAAILDEGEVLMVAGAKTRQIIPVGRMVGSRLPAFCTTLGRVMLAGFSDERLDDYLGRLMPRSMTSHTVTDLDAIRCAILDVRASGYAFADSQVDTGVCSIAVPVTDRSGGTVAALNVMASSARVRRTEMTERFLPLLQQAARDIRPNLS